MGAIFSRPNPCDSGGVRQDLCCQATAGLRPYHHPVDVSEYAMPAMPLTTLGRSASLLKPTKVTKESAVEVSSSDFAGWKVALQVEVQGAFLHALKVENM